MKINFFKRRCQSNTKKIKFGICDDSNGEAAFINDRNETKWIAIVENKSAKEIVFTAIDNCIEIKKENGDMEKRCDGMLTYTDNIIFVELKEKRKRWIQDGIEQLKNTIEIFIADHQLEDFRKKRAFLSNKKYPIFHYGQLERKESFYTKLKVRLFIQSDIKI